MYRQTESAKNTAKFRVNYNRAYCLLCSATPSVESYYMAQSGKYRYHALHHLDARLPYHALPEAHARLLARLPAGSFYHRVTRAGIMAAAREALADARG